MNLIESQRCEITRNMKIVLLILIFSSLSISQAKEGIVSDFQNEDPSKVRVLEHGYTLNQSTLAQMPPQIFSIPSPNCTEIIKWTPCEETCDHGKLVFTKGYCSCICRKNFAITKEQKCVPAFWSDWSSWSNCIPSDWGGLQTRERVCKTNGEDAPGSCIGPGSESRSCSKVTKGYKIRKRLSKLTDEEIHDLIQAMTKFQKDETFSFWDLASWHGWPHICPWNREYKTHAKSSCSWHYHPLFFPWHRLYVVQFELGISRFLKNKTLGLPFWDFTEATDDLPELIRNPEIYDPVLQTFVRNPFHRSFIMNIDGLKIFTRRHPWWPGFRAYGFQARGTVHALLTRDYARFSNNYERNPHDQIHYWSCAGEGAWSKNHKCHFAMSTPSFAAFDPLFYLLHSNVDRFWTMRRKLEEENGFSDWTKSRTIEPWLRMKDRKTETFSIKNAFEWNLSPFCNESMNLLSTSASSEIWKMQNLFYEENLFGYKYEDFDLGDYSWSDIKQDFVRNVLGDFWNDEYFVTEIGELSTSNTMSLQADADCPVYKYLSVEK